MKTKNENLIKLLKLVGEISNTAGNEWFKAELISKLGPNSSPNMSKSQMDEIYEYCLRKIVRDHADKFYYDFKLLSIREKLIEDFIRMEKFRRDDNFEDFCLALFQQLEAIVNVLINEEIHKYIIEQQSIITHKVKNKETNSYQNQSLWQLIFFPRLNPEDLRKKIVKPPMEWDFLERYKVVLYYYYFGKKIYNYNDFQTKYFLGNDLYQSRNLNHRGGKTNEKQKVTLDKVLSERHRYYFKFLGFLEDFISSINKQI
jgi:hypothetical protein